MPNQTLSFGERVDQLLAGAQRLTERVQALNESGKEYGAINTAGPVERSVEVKAQTQEHLTEVQNEVSNIDDLVGGIDIDALLNDVDLSL